MPLNLLKMAVGIDDVAHLAEVQQRRLEQAEQDRGVRELRHVTRHMPRRSAEILEGGSIYWIVKGLIPVRQRILRLDRVVGEDGKSRCGIILDPEMIHVRPRRHRPMQGWRYLEAGDAPPDGAAPTDADLSAMPAEMAAELRELGLL